MKSIKFLFKAFVCLLIILYFSLDVLAADYDLTSLSIEDLMNIQVSLDTRQDRPVNDAAAAIYVITREDIESMGCHTIMDLLRMVPGMNVANLNNNIYAITARGLNSFSSNKLQVLIDGRSIYTPIFSGVVWDAIDLVIDDIEQIEVIRGPGATLWGSNAVNGIINIKTRNSNATEGLYSKVGFGNEVKTLVESRFGQKISPKLSYRVYGKYFNKDGTLNENGTDLTDDWKLYRTGFRVDYQPSLKNTIVVHGNIYKGEAGQNAWLVNEEQEFVSPENHVAELNGGYFVANWSHVVNDHSEYSVKFYWDYQSRSEPILFNGFFHQYDLDFQHAIHMMKNHQFIYGFSYHGQFTKSNDAYYIKFDPISRFDNIYSAFFQDEISLVKNKLRVLIGSKFEHNEFTGLEIQPSFRMIYKLNQNVAFWGSQSRAVRTPARIEQDMIIGNILIPFSDNPLTEGFIIKSQQRGDRSIVSEILNASEIGFRFRVSENLNFDVSTFYHDYDKLRSSYIESVEYSDLKVNPIIQMNSVFNNNGRIWSNGIELSVDYKPIKSWMIRGGYSYNQFSGGLIDKNLYGPLSDKPYEKNPAHQAMLLNRLAISKWLNLSFFLRYIDNIPKYDVKSYYEMDVQIRSRVHKHLEVSILGQNLLNDNHREFNETNLPMSSTYIQRSIWGGIAINY